MTSLLRRVQLAMFWAAAAASFTGQARALDVEIASERISPGDRQAVTVSGLGRGVGLDLAWIDPTGRVRLAWELTANRRGRAAVRFRTAGALPGRHRVVAWLPAATGDGASPPERPVIEAEGPFDILPGEPPEYVALLDAGQGEGEGAVDVVPGFTAVARAAAPPPGGGAQRTTFVAAGWLARVLDGGPPFLELDPARVRALRTAYGKMPSDELLARPVCLRERSWREHVWQWAGPNVEHAARGGPWLWSLGRGVGLAADDGRLDFCRSPHCMHAFASHLHRRYANVEQLNQVWRTSLMSFGNARPATTAEVLAALVEIERGLDTGGDLAARLPGMLVSWNDHRSFLDATWAQTLAMGRELVRSVDRRAKVGLEGVRLPGIFTGSDPTRLARVLDWAATEPRPLELALVRGFAPRGCRAITELGRPDPALDLWRGFAGGQRGAILHSDETSGGLSERDPRDLARALRKLDEGVASLVGRSTWEPDPVAVFYSQDSLRVEWLLANAGLPEDAERAPAGRALRGWAQILADIGVSAEFVDSNDVARRRLRKSSARVLILPRAYVLGGPAFSEIRRFVRAGGLVIADAGAGLFDEKFGDTVWSPVNDLFAIRRPRGRARSGEGELTLAGVDVPGAFIDGVGAEGLRVAEGGLRALPGFALARWAAPSDLGRHGSDRAAPSGPGRHGSDRVETPDEAEGTVAIVSAPVGRGRAVYLNLALEHYPTARVGQGGANLRRLARNALELAGVVPRVEILSEDGPVWGCERNSWRLEETQVFTMWLDPLVTREAGTPTLDAELVFDRPAYCYDTLRGVLLGSGRRIPVRLVPGGNVFARMPYDVESISIRARERAGGIVPEIAYEAVVETTTGFAGTHLVFQELLDPEGARVPGGSRTVVAERGVAKGRVRMALNEPPGEYSLVLRDATTGVEGAIAIARAPTELWRRFPPGGAPAGRPGESQGPRERGLGRD
jgi:hypothetical protein